VKATGKTLRLTAAQKRAFNAIERSFTCEVYAMLTRLPESVWERKASDIQWPSDEEIKRKLFRSSKVVRFEDLPKPKSQTPHYGGGDAA
jgi:hypothetical protein